MAKDDEETALPTDLEEIIKMEQLVQREREERGDAQHKLMSSIMQIEENVTKMMLRKRREAGQGFCQLFVVVFKDKKVFNAVINFILFILIMFLF